MYTLTHLLLRRALGPRLSGSRHGGCARDHVTWQAGQACHIGAVALGARACVSGPRASNSISYGLPLLLLCHLQVAAQAEASREGGTYGMPVCVHLGAAHQAAHHYRCGSGTFCIPSDPSCFPNPDVQASHGRSTLRAVHTNAPKTQSRPPGVSLYRKVTSSTSPSPCALPASFTSTSMPSAAAAAASMSSSLRPPTAQAMCMMAARGSAAYSDARWW